MKQRCSHLLPITIAAALLSACSDVDRFPSADLDIPPTTILDASLTFDPDGNRAILTWTSPAPRGGTESIERVEIRYQYGGEFVWDDATSVEDPPTPVLPGRLQMYRLDSPDRGRELRVAVRSYDASGNASEVGNVALLRVPGFTVSGVVVDAISGEAANGVELTLKDEDGERITTTLADGSYMFDDLPEARVVLELRFPDENRAYHDIAAPITVTAPVALDLYLVPHVVTELYDSLTRLGLFRIGAGVGSQNTMLRKWAEWPIPLFVEDFTTEEGLDYGAAALDAVAIWESKTGIDLFERVASFDESRVSVRAVPRGDINGHIGITFHENDTDGSPVRSDAHVADDVVNPATLELVMLHELGHTIRLAHMPRGYLMYAGQPLPSEPTEDETWVVRLLYGLPNGIDASIYVEAP